MSEDYEVGYGKPPRAHQFKPGQSGNPWGRKKGSKNIATIIEAALSETVPITVNGKKKTVTKLEAAVMQQANRAAGGDPRAIKLMVDLLAGAQGREARGVGVEAETPADQQARHARIVEALRKRFEEDDDGRED